MKKKKSFFSNAVSLKNFFLILKLSYETTQLNEDYYYSQYANHLTFSTAILKKRKAFAVTWLISNHLK